MNQDNLRELIRSGLPALKAGGRIAAAAIDDINQSITNPELKTSTDSSIAKEWDARIERAMQEAGATGEGENPVLEAHYRVSKEIRDAAPDDQVRDLGIIAAGQLALHYWIAAFGTMATYAQNAGLEQTAREMSQSAEEAKQADDASTQLAVRLMSEDSGDGTRHR